MKSKAFTIVEVLVVIGIIAILTVIIFPSISNIRAKNRDAEKVSDIAAIQLGLSLYKNQKNGSYPKEIYNNDDFKKYVTEDSLTTPDGGEYIYVPLTRDTDAPVKCTYYHLGIKLELPSGQIDTADTFNSTPDSTGNKTTDGNYSYCDENNNIGINPQGTENMYAVHP